MYDFSNNTEALLAKTKEAYHKKVMNFVVFGQLSWRVTEIEKYAVMDWMDKSDSQHPKITTHADHLPLDNRLNVLFINIPNH